MSYLALSTIFLLLGFAYCAKNGGGSVGQGQYGAGSYGGGGYSSGSGGDSDAQSYAQQPEYSSPNKPSKYPPAMTHERNRQQGGYQGTASSKRYQEKFEGLFDDFPGPKTKQKIYYPGKGYVYMQVPVQQEDKYGKGGSSYSAPPSSSYDDDSYSAPAPAPYRPQRPSYPPAQPSYGGNSYSSPSPAPASYSSGSANEDDDSPFSYMVGKGGSSNYKGQNYQSSSPSSYSPSSPPAQSYKPPTPYVPPSQSSYSSYEPPKQSYQQPKPSYQSAGDDYSPPSSNYQGSSHGSYSSFNPSGYKPSSYPSSYPDTKSASVNSYVQANPFGNSGGSARGFYDLAEMPEPLQGPPRQFPYRRRR